MKKQITISLILLAFMVNYAGAITVVYVARDNGADDLVQQWDSLGNQVGVDIVVPDGTYIVGNSSIRDIEVVDAVPGHVWIARSENLNNVGKIYYYNQITGDLLYEIAIPDAFEIESYPHTNPTAVMYARKNKYAAIFTADPYARVSTNLSTSGMVDIEVNPIVAEYGAWIARTDNYLHLWNMDITEPNRLAAVDFSAESGFVDIEADETTGNAWVALNSGKVQYWSANEIQLDTGAYDFGAGNILEIEAMNGDVGFVVAKNDGSISAYDTAGNPLMSDLTFGTDPNDWPVCIDLDDSTNDIWVGKANGNIEAYDLSGNQVNTTVNVGAGNIIDLETANYETCDDVQNSGFTTLATDMNSDCIVNIEDFAVLANEWLSCIDPGGLNCMLPWQ